MRCKQARRKLNVAFDHGRPITDDVPLMAHVRQCESCAAAAEPLLAFSDDLSAAAVDDIGGGKSLEEIRVAVETLVTHGSNQSQERFPMAAYIRNNSRRFGLGVAAIAAVLLLALLIPFKIQDNSLGYEVAFAGVDRAIAMDTERIDQFLAQLGMEDAQVDVGDCEQTCKLKIRELKSADDAYLVYQAFNDFVNVELKGDVIELHRDGNGEVMLVELEFSDLASQTSLNEEDVHRIVIERTGGNFDGNEMIWVHLDTSDENVTLDIEARNFQLYGEEPFELTEQDIQDLLDAGFDVKEFETEDGGRKMLFMKLNDGSKSVTGEEHAEDSAAKNSSLPEGFELHQNYPNPFNPSTTISFSLPEAQEVTLEVYNVQGQLVATLINDYLSAGSHSVEWNSTDDGGATVASGIYFYRLTAGELTSTKKMSLVK